MTGVVVRIDGVWCSFSLFAFSETTLFFTLICPSYLSNPKQQNDTAFNSIANNEPIFS